MSQYVNLECPVCNLEYEGTLRYRDGCYCSTGCDNPECVAAAADEAYERATARYSAREPSKEGR